jgi:AraC family transcriptional regulator
MSQNQVSQAQISAPLPVIDYRQTDAAGSLLPQPSVLSSSGWNHLHLEVFQQPKFEIATPCM